MRHPPDRGEYVAPIERGVRFGNQALHILLQPIDAGIRVLPGIAEQPRIERLEAIREVGQVEKTRALRHEQPDRKLHGRNCVDEAQLQDPFE